MEIYNNTYTLKNCSYIVNYDSVIENKNIIVENGKIKDIGNYIEGDEIDCREYVVLPGLVNAHTHTPMVVLRGYYDDAELNEWLNKMWEFEKSFNRDLMKLGSEISILEMLLNGTTAFVDMYFNPEDVKELSEKYRIRGNAGYTFLDLLFDPYEIDKKQRSLKPTEYFSPIINVHSLYSVEEKTLYLVKQLKEELKQRLHIHVSETRKEIYEIKKKHGLFPVEYLNSLGLLENTQLVHLGWVASWEIQLLKESSVTYCPTSNMKLATGGSFPLKELSEKTNVTLGTDSAASNNSLDLFREMKNGVLLQRQMYWNTEVKAFDMLKISTLNGYKLLGINGGYIAKGKVADLVLLDKKRFYPLTKERLISNIVYLATGDFVKGVIVNGNIHWRKDLEMTLEEKVRRLQDMVNSRSTS